jgi:hypothetical protein
MVDFEKVLQTLRQIENVFGIVGVVIILTLTIIGFLVFKYLNKSIEKIAEEASEKSLVKFQSKLDEKVETKIKLFFCKFGWKPINYISTTKRRGTIQRKNCKI